MPRQYGHLRLGVLDPEDLALVQQVFDEICKELGAQRNSQIASDLERILLAAYAMGRKNRTGLRAIARDHVLPRSVLRLEGGEAVKEADWPPVMPIDPASRRPARRR